eukprot:5133653-Pyramimonas_sp.AAC.1
MPQDRSKTPNMAPRRPKRPPRALSRGPKRHISLRSLEFGADFCASTFSAPRRPKAAQEAPNTAPRGPKGPT